MKIGIIKKLTLALVVIIFGMTVAAHMAYTTSQGPGIDIFLSNVGISTSTPQGALAVVGNVGIGTWASGGGGLIVYGGGNVGIGSAWPGDTLDVSGPARAAGLDLTTGASLGYVLVSNSVGIGTWMPGSTVASMAAAGGTTPQLQFDNNGAFGGASSSGADLNGNMGLGTTGPLNALAIVGDVGIGTLKSSTDLITTASKGILIVEKNVGIGSVAPGAVLDVNGAIDINGVNGLSYPSSDTTPGGSIAIGQQALASQNAAGSAAYGNTAVGYQAMGLGTMTTAAVGNTAVGFQAMADLTSGSSNTAAGYQALMSITSGTNNTAFGYQALENVGIGSFNTAIGYRALASITTATDDTAAGYEAGMNVTASNVTALGYEAGQSAGANSTAAGTNALQCNTGSNNTAIGYNALSDCSGSDSGGDNTIVGSSAGGSITTGSNNIIIGYNVGENTLTTGSNNILIGVGTTNPVDTLASNTNDELNIGNLLRGDMTNSTSTNNTTLFLQSTSTSVNYLQLAGSASGNPGVVSIGIGTIGTDANVSIELLPKGKGNIGIGTSTPQGYFVVTDGNVGIGTWAPGAALVVMGGNVGIGTNKANYNLQISGCTKATGTTSCIDLAELIPSSQALDAGDVVMLDKRFPATVMKATHKDNNLLFGVVTTDPAIVIEGSSVGIMNGQGFKPNAMKPAVALAGRVPVKANMANGPIAIGDMITSSSVPGIGAKAIDAGRVVGMALEPLNGMGPDEAFKDILVYVNPHWWPGEENHWTEIKDPHGLFDHALLCTDGYMIKVCAQASDPGVLGAYGGHDQQNHEKIVAKGIRYAMVTNKGEDLNVGDYLMSSDRLGMAQKQETGAYMNYTVAKVLENIHWKSGEKSRKAVVFYQVGMR